MMNKQKVNVNLAQGLSNTAYREMDRISLCECKPDREARIYANRSAGTNEEVAADPVSGDRGRLFISQRARTLVRSKGCSCGGWWWIGERTRGIFVVLGVSQWGHWRWCERHGRWCESCSMTEISMGKSWE